MIIKGLTSGCLWCSLVLQLLLFPVKWIQRVQCEARVTLRTKAEVFGKHVPKLTSQLCSCRPRVFTQTGSETSLKQETQTITTQFGDTLNNNKELWVLQIKKIGPLFIFKNYQSIFTTQRSRERNKQKVGSADFFVRNMENICMKWNQLMRQFQKTLNSKLMKHFSHRS